MKEIKTKHYGNKNLIAFELIEGTNELFLAKIPDSFGTQDGITGIIDVNCKEVVPFGELNKLEGIRVVNPNTIIIDYVSIFGDDNTCDDLHGSILCARTENGFEMVYKSDVTRMTVTKDSIIGAHFEDEEDWIEYRDISVFVTEFVYSDEALGCFRTYHIRDGRNIINKANSFINSKLEPTIKQVKKPVVIND